VSDSNGSVRTKVYRIGLTMLVLDAILYFCGVVSVQLIEPLNLKLKVAAWLFLIGSLISLLSIPFVLFGNGWKRFVFAAASLLSLPFWYGFTLY
jgi:hypothetical protein